MSFKMSFKEPLSETLGRFVPDSANGWGWKVWIREAGEDVDTYRCIAVVANNATAHSLKDGLLSNPDKSYEAGGIEITRGCTTGIGVTHMHEIKEEPE